MCLVNRTWLCLTVYLDYFSPFLFLVFHDSWSSITQLNQLLTLSNARTLSVNGTDNVREDSLILKIGKRKDQPVSKSGSQMLGLTLSERKTKESKKREVVGEVNILSSPNYLDCNVMSCVTNNAPNVLGHQSFDLSPSNLSLNTLIESAGLQPNALNSNKLKMLPRTSYLDREIIKVRKRSHVVVSNCNSQSVEAENSNTQSCKSILLTNKINELHNEAEMSVDAHESNKSVVVQESKIAELNNSDYLKNECEKHGWAWYPDQHLPFDAGYEPLFQSNPSSPNSSDLPVNPYPIGDSLGRRSLFKSNPSSLEEAKIERSMQQRRIVDKVFIELRANDRARKLIRLLSPPESKLGSNLLSSFDIRVDDFKVTVLKAIDLAVSKAELIESAAIASSDFQWPSNIFNDSIEVAENGGRLSAVIARRRVEIQKNGWSKESITKTLGANHPDIDKLHELLEHGAVVNPGPNFAPNNNPNPRRLQEIALGNTIPKGYVKLRDELKGLILDRRILHPSEALLQNFPDNHWVKSVEADGTFKPSGRICIDGKNTLDDAIPLNSDVTRDNAILDYGRLEIPPFHSMIRQLIEYCEMYGIDVSHMRIAKSDVPGAFTKFAYATSSGFLMCSRISKHLFFFPLNGNFGTSTAPFVWNAIMTPIDDLILRLSVLLEDMEVVFRQLPSAVKEKSDVIDGAPKIGFVNSIPVGYRSILSCEVPASSSAASHSVSSFSTPPLNPSRENCPIFIAPAGTKVGFIARLTDDIIEFSPYWFASRYHESNKAILESYFGKGQGFKPEKDLPPSDVQIVNGIGIDLRGNGVVFLPKKHWLRLLKELFLFQTDKAHSLHDYQSLGSILERASIMLQGLSLYLSGVYGMIARFPAVVSDGSTGMSRYDSTDSKEAFIRPDSHCRMCVQMARILCLWMFIDPAMTAVPMATVLSKQELPNSYRIYTDAGTHCPVHGGGDGVHCSCINKENRIGVLIQSPSELDVAYASLKVSGSVNDYSELFQTHYEFLGKLAGLMTLSKLSICTRGLPVTFYGDNTAALSWVKSGKTKSNVCVNMNIASCFFALHTGIIEGCPVQLKSKEMGIVDVLSRGDPSRLNEFSKPSLTSAMRKRLDNMVEIDLNNDSIVSRLLQLVTPPKRTVEKELRADGHLLNPIDSIVQILEVIREIPRNGNWSLPQTFPDHGL